MRPWIAAVALWCLKLALLAQPDNDHFVHRVRLSGQNASAPFYLLDATMEPGEAELFSTRGQSIWFEWTAPADGHFQVLRKLPDTEGWSINYPHAWVSVGNELSDLQTRLPAGGFQDAPFACKQGEIFQIALSRREEALPGMGFAGVMEVRFIPLLGNDHFADRIRLPGETFRQTTWLTGMNPEPDVPGIPHALAWWTWTAPASGEVDVTAEPAGLLFTFLGEQPQSLELVSSNSHPAYGLRFSAVGGQTYQLGVADWNLGPVTLDLKLSRPLRLAGVDPAEILRPPVRLELTVEGFVNPALVTNLIWWSSTMGEVRTNRLVPLSIAELIGGEHRFVARAECSDGLRYHLPETIIRAVHANDNFASAGLLEGDRVEFTADPRGATMETGELGTAGSIWWRWVAPFSGRVQFQYLEGGRGATVELWAGSRVDQLTPVVDALAADGLVTGGVTYAVRVSGEPWSKGRFRLELLPVPAPNDAFSQALVLPPGTFTNRVELGDSTVEAGEPPSFPAGQARRSVWYAFTPPRDGTLRVQAPGLGVDVYQGDSLAGLTRVAVMSELRRFMVEGSRPYRIRVTMPDWLYEPRWAVAFEYLEAPPNDRPTAAINLEGSAVSFTADLSKATPDDSAGGYPTMWWRWTAPKSGWAVLRHRNLLRRILDNQVIRFSVYPVTNLLPEATIPLVDLSGYADVVGFEAQAGVAYAIQVAGGNLFAELKEPAEVDLTLAEHGLEVWDGEGWLSAIRDPVLSSWWPPMAIMQLPTVAAEHGSVSLRISDSGGLRPGWKSGLLRLVSPLLYVPLISGADTHAILQLTNVNAGWHSVVAVLESDDGYRFYTPPTRISVLPDNDSFTDARLLTGHRAQASGMLHTASLEPGEPALGSPPVTRSVWHRWIAPGEGEALVQIWGGGAPQLRIFTGEEVGSLIEVNARLSEGQSYVSAFFPAIRHRTYWIQAGVRVTDPVSGSPYDLELSLGAVRWDLPPHGFLTEDGSLRLAVSTSLLPEDILHCDFLVDGAQAQRVTTAPWEWEWQPLPAGNRRISAVVLLQTGEVLGLPEQEVLVRPRCLNPQTAEELTGAAGRLSVPFRPRDFGETNRAWFWWTAPATGVFVVWSRAGIEVSREESGSAPVALNNVAPTPFASTWVAFPVRAGDRHLISTLESGDFAFELLPPVGNDDFAQAAELSGTEFELKSHAWLATAQPGEPGHGEVVAQRSQWWRWTAPADGYLQHSYAYVGVAVDQLTRLPRIDHFLPTVRVTNGVTYHLALDGGSTFAPPFETTVPVKFTPLLANDHFANRTPLAGRRVGFSVSLDLASSEPNEPSLWMFDNPGKTAWWTWTAPASGPVVFRTRGVSSYLDIAVFRDNRLSPQMPLVARGRDWLRFNATAGEVLQLVAGVRRGDYGTFDLEIISEAPPPNDEFGSPLEIPAQGGQVAGWNFGAHREFQEPIHLGQFGGRSVWYRWRPVRTGTATITLEGDLGRPLVAVYSGDSLDQLELTDYRHLDGHNLSFTVVAGRDYAIAVDGMLGDTGDFTLKAVVVPEIDFPLLEAVWLNSAPALKLSGHAVAPLRLESSTDLLSWQTVAPIAPAAPSQAIAIPAEKSELWFRLVVDE